MLALAVLLAAATASPPGDFPRGSVVPRVECADTPGQSYALYLPPGYSRDREWPTLFLFDARSRGAFSAGLFSDAAGKYGWIIVSSNNTQSDGPIDPNITAFRAMWRDTHNRLSIDPKRVYAGGFSGGARVATLMGTTAPGTVAGVIGCGAGFHTIVRQKPPFVYFGTAGYRDFNYSEMRALGARLEELGVAHRIEHFDGDHEWPPGEICFDAVEWMELEAIRAGIAPRSNATIEAMFVRRRDRARSFEAARPADALAEYRAIVADFLGLREIREAQESVARLERSPEVARAIAEDARRDREEASERETLTPVWAEIRGGDAIPLRRLVQELHIPELRERAAKDPRGADGLAAQRLLNEISTQVSFYLASGYRNEKNHGREILCLSIAIEAKPESPNGFYRRAEAYAVANEREKAFADLSAAVQKGFDRADYFEKDEDLTSLRGDARFSALLDGSRANAAKSSSDRTR